MTYTIERVDVSQAQYIGHLGTKRKYWFVRNGRRCMFKAETRFTGEDWSEKNACELAEMIGLPHVHYEMASEHDGEK